MDFAAQSDEFREHCNPFAEDLPSVSSALSVARSRDLLVEFPHLRRFQHSVASVLGPMVFDLILI